MFYDTQGVEEISPGSAESSRPTRGAITRLHIHLARSAASEASISVRPLNRIYLLTLAHMRHQFWKELPEIRMKTSIFRL